MADNLLLTLDIGSESLKMAEFTYPDAGGMILENFAFVEYGEEKEDDDILDGLADNLSKAIEENGFISKDVHLSISGQSAFVKHVKLPIAGDDYAQIKQMVEYEAEQNIPFPIDEVVWDYQLIQNDSEDGMEVVFVVVKKDIIEKLTTAVESAGKRLAIIEIASTAAYNSATASGIGKEECSVILNIGGRCSTLIFMDNGRMFIRSIPIAGDSITQQVAKEFGISFHDAEEMKRRHGFVALGGAYEDPDSEVAATISKIVRNVMTRLHGEINRSINVYRSQQKGNKPTKLLLAGGSSVMAFTPRFFSDKLRIPVEYFNPFQIVSLSDEIDKEYLAEVAHMFSEVIGLGLRKMAVCPVEISLVPEDVKSQYEFKKKTPYLIGSAAALLLCLLLVFWGVSRTAGIETKNVADSMSLVKKAQDTKKKINKLKTDIKNLKNRYNTYSSYLNNRTEWSDVLNELQSVMPNSMWLTKISFSGAVAKVKAQPKKRGRGGMFGGGRKSRTSRSAKPKASADVASNFKTIVIEGHCLYGKNRMLYIEDFKNSLKTSKLFDGIQDDSLTFKDNIDNFNVNSFSMKINLKNALSKK